MKVTQAIFPENKRIAFIRLAGPNEFLHDCWAGADELAVIVGLHSPQLAVEKELAQLAKRGAYLMEKCLGTEVQATVKAIIPQDSAQIRALLTALEAHGLLSKSEKDKALKELGVRNAPFHPLLSADLNAELHIGAGI